MTLDIARAACADSPAASDSAFVSFRRRLLRNKLSFVAFCAIVLLVVIAILAPWIAPLDPNEPDANAVLERPSWAHVLGTDDYGRDEFSRIIIASRVDLLVPFVSTLLALLIGSLIGAISGFQGGWLDQIVTRIVDAVMAFPAFVLAMGLTAAIGGSMTNLILVIAVTQVPVYLRQ
jgi:ABC-type dipeptide/oligopeptide/nickel transport system permease subunit